MRRWEQQVENAHDHYQRDRQSVRGRRRQFRRRLWRKRVDDFQGDHDN
jgi:hypothetical protein